MSRLKLGFKFGDLFKGLKKEKKVEERKVEVVEESVSMLEHVVHKLFSVHKGFRVIEEYPIREPFAYIRIVEEEETGKLYYEVYEVSLTDEEKRIFDELKEHIMWELKPLSSLDIDVSREIMRTARRIIREFQLKFTTTPSLSWSKIEYYVERDLVGFGVLDPIFRDRYVEDISCNGVGRSVYVWHRKYESLPTNIIFNSEEELDGYVLKLAHMAGKHISVAYPILDAILPGGHRLAATFKKEVSTSGSTFTIRKFSESPITIADMIDFGTISSKLAAYFWLAMDYKMTTLIMGVTGAGKTTTLNALATLLRPTYKIVTIEDTPELRLPHENWVQLVSRPSYVGSGVGEVSLFHLVKLSLRYRPDVIIVGEVRGEEAYVLFQAIATGHSGMTTLHAEHIEAAVKRLTSPPMNIPPSYIPLLNIALVIKRVELRDEKGRIRFGRRITNVWEIRDYNDYIEIARWNPIEDKFNVDLSRSIVLKKISELSGHPVDSLIEEIGVREKILTWLVKTGRKDYKSVATYIYKYYLNPDKVLKEVKEFLR
ncbi:MAG: type II/IV secretion system ATPase subunit [Ignisphaera sp.]|nr:type II/IV secretion system ATPase subunit [Ignisphaera sp.]